MQPPTRRDLEGALAAAKREGRAADVEALESRLRLWPVETEELVLPAQPERPIQPKLVERRFISLGPPENHERDRRLLESAEDEERNRKP